MRPIISRYLPPENDTIRPHNMLYEAIVLSKNAINRKKNTSVNVILIVIEMYDRMIFFHLWKLAILNCA